MLNDDKGGQACTLQQEQTRVLYMGLPNALVVNASLALVLAAVQLSVIAPFRLFGWLALLGSILLIRGILLLAWRCNGLGAEKYDSGWMQSFRITALATGMAWGTGAVLLFPAGDVPHQAMLAMVLAGLSAGAITTLAVDRVSTLGFLVPTLLPLAVSLAAEGGKLSLNMSLMAALSLVLFVMSAGRLRGNLHENFRLRVEAASREQMLSQREAGLNEAQEVAHMGSFDWYPVSGKLHWSAEHFRLWGLAPESVTPDYALYKQAIHPDDVEWVEKKVQHALQEGGLHEYAHRVIWPDGSEHEIQLKGEVKHDAAGQAVRALGTVQDITERKRIEEALLNAKETAEAASRAKSEFLACMSHELRTPLHAVLGFSQLIATDPELSELNRDYAGEIEQAGNHLLTLINDMIDLARIEAGRIAMSIEPVSVAFVVEDSLALMAPIASKQGIAISQEIGCGETAMVLADHNRLRQVVINLLSNAIKYNRPQGSVTISSAMRDGRVRISVADTGPGIAADKKDRIFNAFDRLGAEHGTVEGTGIGLVITKRIVETMGGNIGFDSIHGQGSCFWVEFPPGGAEDGSGPELTVAAKLAEPHERKQARSVVLHIEDDAAARFVMQRVFARREELELRDAESAEIGISLAWAEPPALILMDINLPGMDGYEALGLLKGDAMTAHVPVIALTANAMQGDDERGLAAGFDAYVTKPVNIKTIFDLIDGLLVAGSIAADDAKLQQGQSKGL
ncbi:MAG TPA: ATP-binding protein [Gallionellaceae bacterium]|nr:ATP-binding protein [Gallionellaceae bacterium]